MMTSNAEYTLVARVDYRIEYKKPGKRKWEYGPFTGASNTNRDKAIARMARAYEESPPGWKFRLVERETRIFHTPWVEVQIDRAEES